MFLRTPTLRSGGLKLSYTYLRQRRLLHNVTKPVPKRGLVFLCLESGIMVKPR